MKLTKEKDEYYLSNLLNAVRKIKSFTKSELASVEHLTKFFKTIGPCSGYQHSWADLNVIGSGFAQHPQELAEALVFLSNFEVKTFLEIGSFLGWTTSVIAAYLSRFNKYLEVTTIDVQNVFKFYQYVKHILPITYLVPVTSKHLKGKEFDVCFIDGNHCGDWPKDDYNNIGRFSRICMFHDILHAKDVKSTWKNTKTKNSKCQIKEFVGHKKSKGIGVLVLNGEGILL